MPTRLFRIFLILLMLVCLAVQEMAYASGRVRLKGHVPEKEIEKALKIGRLDPASHVALSVVLKLNNEDVLQTALTRLYDPKDPLFGKFLTPDEFRDYFCPSEKEYEEMAAYLTGLGLTVTGRHPNRLILNVEGSAEAIESAFNLQLNKYRKTDGREFYAPDDDPEVSDSAALMLTSVVGLDNAVVWHPHKRSKPAEENLANPNQIGSGPGGGLTPGDIVTAYNLGGVKATGTGQVLGLFELDGYMQGDIAAYANYFSLPSLPISNVLVDGVSGQPGSGAGEVTLDIQLMMAMASGASQIIVYEGPNSAAGVLDTYSRIANDNQAKQISTSWGIPETYLSYSFMNAENSIFRQMAVQGQTIFAAAGDRGAYDNGSTLSVDDPAAQPYVAGVGGTQLSVKTGGSYDRESTWNVDGTPAGGAGGGGVSSYWRIPSWQQNVISSASGGSTVLRNVPDIALNSDQNSGYAIFFNGNWEIAGGTSCAAPLWAAFIARVNQLRAERGTTPLGFINPSLYTLGTGPNAALDFHDVADGSDNLAYPAVVAYDNATGWGSFNGAYLLTDLVLIPAPTFSPGTPTNLTAAAGNAKVTLKWTASADASTYNIYRGTAPGAEDPAPIAGVASSTTYTDTGLINGTTYYYYVKASNVSGISEASNEVSAKPLLTAPTAPTGLKATADNATVYLTWTASADAVAYNIYRGTSSLKESTTPVASGITVTTFTNTGLSNGTTYYYYVKATNAAGTSPASNEASAKPYLPLPSAPTNLTAAGYNASVLLTWAPSANAASYSIYRGTAPGMESTSAIKTGLTVTSFINTSLTNGVTYYYTVKAVNKAGTSAASNEASAKPAFVPPPAPTNLKAAAAPTAVTLTWAASASATSYSVYRGTTAGGESPTPIAKGLTSTSYTNSSLPPGQTYYYYVQAVNAAGSSASSDEAFATPGLFITSGPTVVPGKTSTTITWTTSLPSYTLVSYGTTTSLGKSVSIKTLVTTHTVTLSSLTSNVTYYFKVSSTASSTTVTSPVQSFKTTQ